MLAQTFPWVVTDQCNPPEHTEERAQDTDFLHRCASLWWRWSLTQQNFKLTFFLLFLLVSAGKERQERGKGLRWQSMVGTSDVQVGTQEPSWAGPWVLLCHLQEDLEGNNTNTRNSGLWMVVGSPNVPFFHHSQDQHCRLSLVSGFIFIVASMSTDSSSFCSSTSFPFP